jgi:hypothetical protein
VGINWRVYKMTGVYVRSINHTAKEIQDFLDWCVVNWGMLAGNYVEEEKHRAHSYRFLGIPKDKYPFWGIDMNGFTWSGIFGYVYGPVFETIGDAKIEIVETAHLYGNVEYTLAMLDAIDQYGGPM